MIRRATEKQVVQDTEEAEVEVGRHGKKDKESEEDVEMEVKKRGFYMERRRRGKVKVMRRGKRRRECLKEVEMKGD